MCYRATLLLCLLFWPGNLKLLWRWMKWCCCSCQKFLRTDIWEIISSLAMTPHASCCSHQPAANVAEQIWARVVISFWKVNLFKVEKLFRYFLVCVVIVVADATHLCQDGLQILKLGQSHCTVCLHRESSIYDENSYGISWGSYYKI